MSFPIAIGICENDLRFDLTFLKEFAAPAVDLRVTPVRGGTLNAKTARLVERQATAMKAARLSVCALVVHHDVDRSSHGHRIKAVRRWFKNNGLGKHGLALVVCAPDPCLERWLCLAEGIHGRVRGTKPSAGGEPWKVAWNPRKGIALDRVRAAAKRARKALRGQPDFAAFLAEWSQAFGS